jgi:hypothetical protein
MPLPDIKPTYKSPFPYVPRGGGAWRAKDSMLETTYDLSTTREPTTKQSLQPEHVDQWERIPKRYRDRLGKAEKINPLKNAEESIDTFGRVEDLD